MTQLLTFGSPKYYVTSKGQNECLNITQLWPERQEPKVGLANVVAVGVLAFIVSANQTSSL